MKKSKIFIGIVVILLVSLLSSCDILNEAFGTYSIEIKNYNSIAIYTVEYRKADSTTYTKASLKDEEGNSVTRLGYLEKAKFTVPGKGDYVVRASSILGTTVGKSEEVTVSIVDDMDGYVYSSVSISSN